MSWEEVATYFFAGSWRSLPDKIMGLDCETRRDGCVFEGC